MASDKQGDQRSPSIWLLSITGIFVASPFLVMASFSRYGNSFPVLSAIVLLVSLPLFVLSFVLLSMTAWWGVSFRGMTKMEAWWWLSAPYSIAFQFSVLVFARQEYGRALAPFFLVYMVDASSSAVWVLVTICQLAFSQTRLLTGNRKLMLAFAALATLPWAWWLK